MASSPYFKFFTGDVLKETHRLGTNETAAYHRMLIEQWHEGPFPDDEQALASAAGLRIDVWRKVAPTLRRLFQPSGQGPWALPWLEKQRAKLDKISALRAEVGSMGGHATALKTKETVAAIASQKPKQAGSRRRHKPDSRITPYPLEKQAELIPSPPKRPRQDVLAKETILPPEPKLVPEVPEGNFRGYPADEIVPREVNGHVLEKVFDRCCDILDAGDREWKYFRSMLVRVLRDGADPTDHIFPAVEDIRARFRDIKKIGSPNLFEKRIRDRMPAPDLRHVRRSAA